MLKFLIFINLKQFIIKFICLKGKINYSNKICYQNNYLKFYHYILLFLYGFFTTITLIGYYL